MSAGCISERTLHPWNIQVGGSVFVSCQRTLLIDRLSLIQRHAPWNMVDLTMHKLQRVDGVDVAQETERNFTTAKYVAWPCCACLLLSFFLFPVRHPLHPLCKVCTEVWFTDVCSAVSLPLLWCPSIAQIVTGMRRHAAGAPFFVVLMPFTRRCYVQT